MKWDTAFKSIDPPPILFTPFELGPDQKDCLSGYRNISVSHPGWTNLGKVPKTEGLILDHAWKWFGQRCPAQKGECRILLQNHEKETKETEAFCKITHILDPVKWIKGKYSDISDNDPEHQKAWEAHQAKTNDPMNQAYTEALSYYCCSRLREKDVSPHFPWFYGSFCALADSYKLNITDDFDHYRGMKWFWEGYDKRCFQLLFENAEHETESERAEWTRRPSFLEDDDSDETEGSGTDSGDESLDPEKEPQQETASLHSADDLSFHTGSTSDDESSSTTTSPSFFLELKNFPVMMMYLEKNDGVMDDLLAKRNQLSAKPGTPEWDILWSAWLFQILAALCVIQNTLSMTHNDLHSNNIVFSETTEEFLYYQKRDGTTWKVPTYGKIFRIIDFGRAIFRLGQKVIFSDDFREGNDAATQYNFGPLRDSSRSELCPNPSFDLARLAVSMFETLFPEEPEKKKGGKVLSSEEGLVVRETKSDLFNVMWSWMVTDFGENILINAAGEEKYPDFDLYNTIAEQCHSAIPAEQVEKRPFSQFKIPKTKVPTGQKIYSLFF